MAVAAGFWRRNLERFQEAFETRNVDAFFLASSEDSRQMRATYTKVQNLEEFLVLLQANADAEDAGLTAGSGVFFVGGCR